MNSKEYKKGLEDASTSYGKKFDQVTESLNDIHTTIGGYSEVTDELLNIAEEHDNRFNDLDHELKFGKDIIFQTPSIAEEMKPILYRWMFSALKKAYDDEKPFNEQQQQYFTYLSNFLGVKNAVHLIDLHIAHKIQDITYHQFLACIYLELIYLDELAYPSESYLYQPLSYLHVSNHFIKSAQAAIVDVAKFQGIDFIVNRYRNEHETFETAYKYDSDQPMYETITKPTNLSYVSTSIYNIYYYVQNSISLTENMHFEHCTFEFNSELASTIILKEPIDVTFENCVFKVVKPSFDSTFNIEKANFTFKNCQFININNQYNESVHNNGFFKLEQGTLTLENCHVSGCTGALLNLSDCSAVNIHQLQVSNHSGNLLGLHRVEKAIIDESHFMNVREDSQDKAFIEFNFSTLQVTSCTVNNKHVSSSIGLFSGFKSALTFNYCNISCSADENKNLILKNSVNMNVHIYNSEFYNCLGFEGILINEDNYYLENTKFHNCEGTLIAASAFTITNCLFDHCTNNDQPYEQFDIDVVDKESNQTFYNATTVLGSLIATRGSIFADACVIKDSLFKNCQSYTLIYAPFQSCEFTNNRVIHNSTKYLPLKGRIKKVKTIFTDNEIANANIKIIAENYIGRLYSIAPSNAALAKDVSEKAIANAKRKFALLDANNPFIALIDTTIFNSGKSGIALSTRNISFSNFLSKPYTIPYKDLRDIAVKFDKKNDPYSSIMAIKTQKETYNYSELSLDKTELEGLIRDIMLYQLLFNNVIN